MRFALGTDENRAIVDHICTELVGRGHAVERLDTKTWGAVAIELAGMVAIGKADSGIVCCWTGTGVCLAANKVRGVRAALCGDAATAAGARKWNNANVLALSLRLLSESVASEILEAWLQTPYGGTEDESLSLLESL